MALGLRSGVSFLNVVAVPTCICKREAFCFTFLVDTEEWNWRMFSDRMKCRWRVFVFSVSFGWKLDIVWSGNKLVVLVECSLLQRFSSLTIHIHHPIASGERPKNHDLGRLIYLP